MNMPSGSFEARSEELIKALDHTLAKPEAQAIPEVYDALSVLSHMTTSNAAAIRDIIQRLENANRNVEALLGRLEDL